MHSLYSFKDIIFISSFNYFIVRLLNFEKPELIMPYAEEVWGREAPGIFFSSL